MEKVICKAQIEPKRSKTAFVLIIVSLIVYFAISCVVRVRYSDGWGDNYGYNFLGDCITTDSKVGPRPIESLYNLVCQFNWCPVSAVIFYLVCLCLITAICIIFGSVRAGKVAGQCTLTLEKTGIIGKKTGLASSKELKLPMDKIDSISVQNGILDKIFGGQTIAIRSASGLIKFPWVQNAQEFVDTTLAEIQKYNEAAELKSQPAPAAPASDDFEKIQKLKNLLDQGLLTQEEYDAKRRELLEKI